jgi:transcriptional regulator with XRE-family HTH domain
MQWSDQVQEACTLILQGELSQKEIAAKVGVSPRTLRNWARDPEWKARYTARHTAMLDEWDRGWRVKLKLRQRDELVQLETYLDTEIAALKERTAAKRERLLCDTRAAYRR